MNGIELEYYGGNGYFGVPERSVFKVKCSKPKIFYSLTKARDYYDSLNEEKALWHHEPPYELLECHVCRMESPPK